MFEHVLLNVHAREKQETSIVPSETIDLFCPICNNQSTNEKHFYDHLQVHINGDGWKRMEYSEGNDEVEPETTIKNQANCLENVARPFKCGQCDLTFDRASQLDYHRRSLHLGEKSQLCEICGKGFFRKTDLRTHLNIHLGTNLCICEICGRQFNHISNLIRHCRMHAGVKPYPCSVCGKRFTQISSLARHKRIHERSKEHVKQQLQNNCISSNTQKREHTAYKDQVVEGNIPNHRKTVKRQHYCKICGESFNFIFLLRQHEKSHSESATILKCKDSEKNFQKITELDEQECHAKGFGEGEDLEKNWEGNTDAYKATQESNSSKEFDETESGIAKKGLPLETIIYITSEQFKKINLEHMEDTNDHFLQEHLIQIDERIKSIETLNVQATNISEMQISNNGNKSEKDEAKVIDPEIDLYPFKSNEIAMEDDIIHRSFQDELQKSEKTINCNATISIPVDVVDDVLRKTEISLDSAITEQIKTDFSSRKGQEANSTQIERNVDDLNNTESVTNHEEPMLRLVQTETGEQFYEFIISNLVEKLPGIQSSKLSDEKFDESTSENIRNTCLNSKDIVNEEIEREQDLRDIAEIHNDLNYTQYELQGEEKNFAASQALLGNDPQTDFDRYVEANLEVFERLNYENSSERFLEFVEIPEGTPETSMYKESPLVRFIQNEGEQFFELLQDTQSADKNEGQDFIEINQAQQNETTSDNDEQILLTCLKDDSTQFQANTENNNEISVENDELIRNEANADDDEKESNSSQELKKSKIFLIRFQCTVCEKSFSTGYNYKQHIGTHFADQQKFHCKECKMSFAWKSTLNKHIANNHRPDGPQKFVCELCPRVYNTLSQVNEHVKRDHLKQRNHICTHCGKSFFKKYDLKIHNRIHTDERPYVCRACGKRFHHRSHIIRHERIHF